VLSVTTNDATLTANSLNNLSGTARITRTVPRGIAVAPNFAEAAQFTSSTVPQGLFPDVPLGFGWQVATGTGTTTLYSPVIPVPTDSETPYRIWWWLAPEAVTGAPFITLDLVNEANQTQTIGASVLLDDDLEGSFVRVLFESPVLLDCTSGVRIRATIAAGQVLTFGPIGAAPASWTALDVDQPRACDLWHEGTLWLRTQSVPEGYDLDFVDLYSVDATAYPWEQVTLGGELVVDDLDLGIRSTQRVVALTRDYLAPGSGQVTLGRRERGLAEYLASQQNVSISDIALRLSRGLAQQVEILRRAPSVVATSDAITQVDPTPIAQTAGAIQAAFSEGN